MILEPSSHVTVRAWLNRGIDPSIFLKDDLSSHFRLFLSECKSSGLSPATLVNHIYKTGEFMAVLSRQGVTMPAQVTSHHVRLFLIQKQETVQASTVAAYYRTLHRFFNYLVNEKVISVSPMSTMKSPKVPVKLIVPMQADQIQRLLFLNNKDTFTCIRNTAIIRMLYDTGVRRKELADIQLADFSQDYELLRIMGKGARERMVRLGIHTQKALVRYMKVRKSELPNLWLTEERQPLTVWGIKEMFKKLAKRAELSGVRVSAHTLRHSFATTLIKKGAGELAVQTLLGHATRTMTQRYVASVMPENALKVHRQFSPGDSL